MESSLPSSEQESDGTVEFSWLPSEQLRDVSSAQRHLAAIWNCGATEEQLATLGESLQGCLTKIDDFDSALQHLSRFVQASDDPVALVSQMNQDQDALGALLHLFATSQSLASRIVSDPAALERLRASDQLRATRQQMIDELLGDLSETDQPTRAAEILRKFYARECVRISHHEFVRGISPEKVGRQLAAASDAIIEGSFQFSLRRLAERRGMPERPDGTTPQVTVIGLGNLGGEEMGYWTPMNLVFLYDSIDHKNVWHRDFYQTLVADVVGLLRGEESRADGVDIDLREGPKNEVGVHICGVREAARIYETSGRTWQRLGFVKARVVAGSQTVGAEFLRRMDNWVYHRFVSRVELAEIRTLRHKLERRAEQETISGADVLRAPGGRSDIELTIQFLQLLHGARLKSVRCGNTIDAIIALEKEGCLTDQESTLLSENYARLCRLQHQLSVMFDRRTTIVPDDPVARRRIAWHLGIRTANPDEGSTNGDVERFEKLLQETFAKNRKIINHLMIDAPGDDAEAAVETELLLDPDPDPELVEKTMHKHGLADPRRAMDDLASLATETVAFLSPHRCRHFFSSIAPALLLEISRTPDPEATLSTMVEVADSLGAKATLWELLGNHRPTMQLLVRLCATTPYLSQILTNNPGMIDELIDSLLINRLPSAQRLDAQSIELCRGAIDIERILHSFKNGAHLMIGVRDMLGMESIEATHQTLGDTAEACVRRMIDHEHARLAQRYGDPVDEQGNPAMLVCLALGKFGGREPNYHSDLDAVFLYSAEGETKRRIGGHRTTTTNHLFFNQLVREVINRINYPKVGPRLYELDSRLRPDQGGSVFSITVEDFLKGFREGVAPLWQRLALTRARAISGPRIIRNETDQAVVEILTHSCWVPQWAEEIRQMRDRMQATANVDNFKRGEGGTVDVEFVAQMLTLRHAHQSPEIIRRGTTPTLEALASAGHLSAEHTSGLLEGYRTLRRTEANLRLMNTPARHELPERKNELNHLAFLMKQSDPQSIVTMCHEARKNIRAIFNEVFTQAAS